MDLTPAQALRFWRDSVMAQVLADDPDLTVRQMTILLTVYLDPPPHTVRGLAEKLGVTKPVITRALDSMGGMGLVTRRRDDQDRRSVLIQRTVAGAEYVDKLGQMISRQADDIS